MLVKTNQIEKKIFVTGVYGSGKTNFSKHYASQHGLTFKSFDGCFDYGAKDNQSRALLNSLPPSFIIDAIPIDQNASWEDFIEYEQKYFVYVICVYCPDEKIWLRRVWGKERAQNHSGFINYLDDAIANFKEFAKAIKRWCMNQNNGKVFKLYNETERKHLQAYRDFFTGNFQNFRRFKRIVYFDSMKQEYTSEAVMLERIKFKTFPIKDRLDRFGNQYDVNYQDMEELNFIGYSESYRTWEKIQGLIPWEGRRVIDLGCFHGYYSFKVEECGAIVHGFDRSAVGLETARMLNDMKGNRVVFRQWKAGEEIPECDVIMCLNVLHHFGDSSFQEVVLSKMKCEVALFEINKAQESMVKRYFQTIQRYKSHRDNRVILVARHQKS